MRKWACIAAILLLGRSLLPAADVAVSFKLGLGYPFFSGRDYQDGLALLEADFLADEGYFVDWDTRINAKGLGLHAGVSLTLGLSDWFALQPEVFFSRFGGCYGFDDPVNYGEVFFVDRLRCVETILLAAFRFGRGNRKVSLFAGPDVAFRWGEVVEKLYQEGYPPQKYVYPDTLFARLFFNVVGGAGITYYLRNGMLLSLEARYTGSLGTIMNESVTGESDWRQNSVQFMMGIGRVLGGKGVIRRSDLR